MMLSSSAVYRVCGDRPETTAKLIAVGLLESGHIAIIYCRCGAWLEVMLIYSMSVSVDGFIADREGSFGWTAPSEELFRFHLAVDPRIR
jgi:hypothetical protein